MKEPAAMTLKVKAARDQKKSKQIRHVKQPYDNELLSVTKAICIFQQIFEGDTCLSQTTTGDLSQLKLQIVFIDVCNCPVFGRHHW